MDPVTPNGIKIRLPAVVGMTNQFADMLAGFLFGLGFGILIGNMFL